MTSPIKRVEEVTRNGVAPDSGSGTIRLKIVRRAWPRIESNPIVGKGLDSSGSSVNVINHGTIVQYHVHGGPISVWYQAGIFGLVGVLIVVWTLLKGAWRSLGDGDQTDMLIGLSILAAFIAFLVSAMTTPFVLQQYGWFTGVMLIAWRMRREGLPEIAPAKPAGVARHRSEPRLLPPSPRGDRGLPMRILNIVVGAAARTGGAIAFAGEAAVATSRAGGEARVFATDLALAPWGWMQKQRPVRPNELHPSLAHADFELFPTGFPRRLARSPALARALRTEVPKCDVVHIHNLWQHPQYAAFRAAREARVPVHRLPARQPRSVSTAPRTFPQGRLECPLAPGDARGRRADPRHDQLRDEADLGHRSKRATGDRALRRQHG